jgi:regulator of protease activity HflC (stomatin/prohibitin superfamily)
MRERRATIVVITLILLFAAVFFFRDIFITIRPGQAGVLYRTLLGGTQTDRVYGEGLHIIFPFDEMYIYNVRYQRVTRTVEVLTQKGLTVRLGVAIRFHPEYDLLGVLHQQLGPDYVHTVIVPEVESTLLRILGNFDADQVYRSQQAVNAAVINEALDEVAHRFVVVDDVIIREVKLPPRIHSAIESKIEQQQLLLAYEFRTRKEEEERRRKIIEADGIRQYNELVAASISPDVLKWHGIEATRELAKSPNSKVIVVGNGEGNLPVILSTEGTRQ